MQLLSMFKDNLDKILDNEYVVLILLSILTLIVLKTLNRLIIRFYNGKKHRAKEIFRFSQRCNVIINIILVVVLFIIWEKHLNNIVTIISFISAGATIALREVILNFFAGIYIKAAKPFVVEDRIEIDDIKGDVVLISNLSFKLLEVGDRVNGEQSSGLIVNIPNSFIFSKSLKNFTTVFKYIWSELIIKVPIDSDIEKQKKELYKVINSNATLKEIPKKMDRAIDAASSNYRIYYNNLKPIIYTTVVDDHIELCIRFLIHPKKERNVLDEIWLAILKEHKKGTIKLKVN